MMGSKEINNDSPDFLQKYGVEKNIFEKLFIYGKEYKIDNHYFSWRKNFYNSLSRFEKCIVSWEIKNNKLYLIDFCGFTKEGEVGMEALARDNNWIINKNRIFANWFGGVLYLPIPSNEGYSYRSYYSSYSDELGLYIESGELKESIIYKNARRYTDIRPFHLYSYSEYQKDKEGNLYKSKYNHMQDLGYLMYLLRAGKDKKSEEYKLELRNYKLNIMAYESDIVYKLNNMDLKVNIELKKVDFRKLFWEDFKNKIKKATIEESIEMFSQEIQKLKNKFYYQKENEIEEAIEDNLLNINILKEEIQNLKQITESYIFEDIIADLLNWSNEEKKELFLYVLKEFSKTNTSIIPLIEELQNLKIPDTEGFSKSKSEHYVEVDLSHWNEEEKKELFLYVLRGINYATLILYVNTYYFPIGDFNSVLKALEGDKTISINRNSIKWYSEDIKNKLREQGVIFEDLTPHRKRRFYEDYESETYDQYNGSYAQDVEYLSDQFINDVLEGDPDLYWNID